jgi:alpha-beta hydrolase superfamily lysophospholipase
MCGACAFFLLAMALFPQSRPAGEAAFTAYSLKSLQAYPFKTSAISINELAFKNDLQYAYNVSYTSMGLSISGRLSVPAIPPENVRGIVLMLRGHQSPAGYYTGKGTEYPARSYLARGWALIAPDFPGYAASSPTPAPTELHQFYSTLNAVELYLSLQNPDFRYGAAITKEHRAARPSSFKKTALWGHSNGGQVAIQTLEVLRRPVPTVLWAPVCIDFPDSMVNYQKNRKDWADAFKRDYPARDFALLSFLDSIAPGTPILLEQGTNDTSVPKSWSDAFARAVREENARREQSGTEKIALRYEVYDRADHNLAPYWNRVLPGDAAFWEAH